MRLCKQSHCPTYQILTVHIIECVYSSYQNCNLHIITPKKSLPSYDVILRFWKRAALTALLSDYSICRTQTLFYHRIKKWAKAVMPLSSWSSSHSDIVVLSSAHVTRCGRCHPCSGNRCKDILAANVAKSRKVTQSPNWSPKVTHCASAESAFPDRNCQAAWEQCELTMCRAKDNYWRTSLHRSLNHAWICMNIG